MISYFYDTTFNEENKDTYTIGLNYNINYIEESIINELDIKTKIYSSQKEIEKAYNKEEINAYIIKNNDAYTIYQNEMNEDSSIAGYNAALYLDNYNKYLSQNYLNSISANLDLVYNNINYTYKNIEGSNDLINMLISMGFIFIIMSITLTAIYCATDTTAGEKERGTLETFLTFPIKSNELIKGKYLAITISCFITSIISLLLTIISFKISSNIFTIYNDITINFDTTTILLSILILISYSIFISGLCIAIASLSKSYKEAQSKLTPISLLTMIPMFLNLLEIKLTPLLSLIPIINQSMLLNSIACNNIMKNDITNLIIMLISTIIYSFIIIKLISKQYKSEKILFNI